MTSLITGESILSLAALKEKVVSASNLFETEGILAFEKAIVSIPGDIDLLPVLWALLKKKVTCILADPDSNETDFADIGYDNQARYLIRKKGVSGGADLYEVILLERKIPAVPFKEQELEAGFIPYILYDPTTEGECPQIIDAASLDSLFGRLDRDLQPTEDAILFLSKSIPFSRRILELVWASSRGIPVVLDFLKEDTDFCRYSSSPDQFEMGFGLFHFGSYVETSGTNKYKLLFDTVEFADKNGFSSVWTPERHFNEFGGLFPNPSVLSAALAVITSKVQIRSGSLVAPLHHTVRIAEDWSLIDNLSNGRIGISFASGWQCDDFVFFPDNYPQRHDCMMKQIENVRRLWKGETVGFTNGLNKEIEVTIFPKPVQRELPVWITVSGKEETFIDAGKAGANILTHLLWQDSDELIGKIALYREALRAGGFDPRSKKVSVMVHTYLGINDDAVKDKVREPLKNYIRTSTQLIQSMVKSNVAASQAKEVGGRYGGLDHEIPPHLMEELLEIAFNRFFDHAGLLGTIEKARALMKKLKGYDVDEIAALIDFGLGRDDIMEGLTHLNKLRELYDRNSFSKYPVTITHCSTKDLENVQQNSNILHFLEAQKAILMETDGFGKIPPSLYSKIRHVYEPVDLNRNPLFTSSISDEF
ncbi:MAG: MupA/Atu3671 family FMN-dependent luciferase-like monooxygenase [Chitinophaga rupis]